MVVYKKDGNKVLYPLRVYNYKKLKLIKTIKINALIDIDNFDDIAYIAQGATYDESGTEIPLFIIEAILRADKKLYVSITKTGDISLQEITDYDSDLWEEYISNTINYTTINNQACPYCSTKDYKYAIYDERYIYFNNGTNKWEQIYDLVDEFNDDDGDTLVYRTIVYHRETRQLAVVGYYPSVDAIYIHLFENPLGYYTLAHGKDTTTGQIKRYI